MKRVVLLILLFLLDPVTTHALVQTINIPPDSLTIIPGSDAAYNPLTDDGTPGQAAPRQFPGLKFRCMRSTKPLNKQRFLVYDFVPGINGIAGLKAGNYYLEVEFIVNHQLGNGKMPDRSRSVTMSCSVNGAQVIANQTYYSAGLGKVYCRVSQPFLYSGDRLKIQFDLPQSSNPDAFRLASIEIKPYRLLVAKTDEITIGNSYAAFTFDKNGHIVKIKNNQTGQDYTCQSLVETPPLQLVCTGSPQTPILLKCKRYQQVSGADYNELSFEFDAGPDIIAKTTVRVGNDDKSYWYLEIINNSKLTIIEQAFPVLPNIKLGSLASDDTLYWPLWAGIRVKNPAGNLVSTSAHYIGSATMNWAALCDDQSNGLYFASEDKTVLDTTIKYWAFNAASFLSFTKHATIEPGKTWKSSPFAVMVYKGDWHKAADAYRGWALSWMKEPRVPEWVRFSDGIKHIRMQWHPEAGWKPGLECELNTKFADLPLEHERSAKANHLTNLWMAGQMVRGDCYRFYALDPYLGSEDDFKAANREIRSKGGQCVYYTNGMNWDANFPENLPSKYISKVNTCVPGIDNWKQFTNQNCIRQLDGSCVSQYPGPGQWNFRIMCPFTKAWQQYLKYWIVDKYTKEYHASGMQVDQIGITFFGHCFSRDHGHDHNGCTTQGYCSLLETLDREGHKADPDFVTFPELMADVVGQYCQYMHAGGQEYFGENFFPEMYRYTFPRHVLIGRIADQSRQYLLAVKNLSHPTAKSIRQAIRDLYDDSDYRDNTGMSVSGSALASLLEHRGGEQYVIPIFTETAQPVAISLKLQNYPGLRQIKHAYFYNGHYSNRLTVKFTSGPDVLAFSISDPNLFKSGYGAVVLSDTELLHAEIKIPSSVELGKEFDVEIKSGAKSLENADVFVGSSHFKTDKNGVARCLISEYKGTYLVRAGKKGCLGGQTFLTVK